MGCESSHPRKRYKAEFLKVSPKMIIENNVIESKGIVDTASNRTCVNRSFIEKHNLMQYMNETQNSVRCSSGESVLTRWEIPNVKIVFEKVQKQAIITLCIIENLPVPFLIGTDTLKELGEINLNFIKKVVNKNNIVL